MGQGWSGDTKRHQAAGYKGGAASVLARTRICEGCGKRIEKKNLTHKCKTK